MSVLSFPPFRLDVTDERLWKNDRELHVRRKPFAILSYLTRHPRRLVTRSELVGAVWGDVAMSNSLVRTHMHDLRQVLGENIIETVLGRGYRFLVDVREATVTRTTTRRHAWSARRPPQRRIPSLFDWPNVCSIFQSPVDPAHDKARAALDASLRALKMEIARLEALGVDTHRLRNILQALMFDVSLLVETLDR